MKRIYPLLLGTTLFLTLVLPMGAMAQPLGTTPQIPPAGPSECAKLRRAATEINAACTQGTVVGHDENGDGTITCDLGTATDVGDWGACALISNIKFIVDFLFWGFLLISIAFFLWGGLKMMTAAGEPEEFEKGRNLVMYAAVGVLVAFAARLLPAALRGFFGL